MVKDVYQEKMVHKLSPKSTADAQNSDAEVVPEQAQQEETLKTEVLLTNETIQNAVDGFYIESEASINKSKSQESTQLACQSAAQDQASSYSNDIASVCSGTQDDDDHDHDDHNHADGDHDHGDHSHDHSSHNHRHDNDIEVVRDGNVIIPGPVQDESEDKSITNLLVKFKGRSRGSCWRR